MTVRFACAVGVAIVVAGVMGVLATAGRDALSHEDSAGCPIVADEAFINSLNAEERAEVVAYFAQPGQKQHAVAIERYRQQAPVLRELPRVWTTAFGGGGGFSFVEGNLRSLLASAAVVATGLVEDVEFLEKGAVMTVRVSSASKGARTGDVLRVRAPMSIRYSPAVPPECSLSLASPQGAEPVFPGERLTLIASEMTNSVEDGLGANVYFPFERTVIEHGVASSTIKELDGLSEADVDRVITDALK